MKSLTALLLLSLVGCAVTTSTAIRSPQGENWIGIDCSGRSQVSCYAEAGTQCPGGYDIMDNEGHFYTTASSVATPKFSIANVGESHSGSMIIKCHGKSKVEIEKSSPAHYDNMSDQDFR